MKPNWYRYKHSFKGDIWSRKEPVEFTTIFGSGWELIETKNELV